MTQKFCKNVSAIENYKIAKENDFKKWQIHHRLETHNSDNEKRLIQITREELIALDMYYNRPAEELIFLTISEHTRIHHIGNACTKEHKEKTSKTLMGHIVTEETRIKISAKLKGRPIAEDTKKKISKTLKGGNSTSFKKGHKQSRETIEKQKATSRKRMAIKKEIYKTQFQGKITWNEFQKQYKKC